MTMDLTFRPVTESELDACAALFVSAFNRAPWNDSWTHETARARLSDVLGSPGFVGLAAMHDERLCGFVLGQVEQWRTGKHFCLREMCVHPDVQRRGIGTSLLASLEAELRGQGIEAIYLLTSHNLPESFYARNGFRANPHVIVMTRRLTS